MQWAPQTTVKALGSVFLPEIIVKRVGFPPAGKAPCQRVLLQVVVTLPERAARKMAPATGFVRQGETARAGREADVLQFRRFTIHAGRRDFQSGGAATTDNPMVTNRTLSVLPAWVLLTWMLSAWVLLTLVGCADQPPEYGRERGLALPVPAGQVWAVAPAINLSGQQQVDPLLQADMLFEQVQTVRGVTALPVNRTVEVLVALQIGQIQSMEQAQQVCQVLGADALVVPTVSIYDPYNPPKFGATLTVFRAPSPLQATGMFDAANGSVRDALRRYAQGRFDPQGSLGEREYLLSMPRYCGFAYHQLLEDLVRQLAPSRK